MSDDAEVERARAQVAEALDIVFVRWGEWHLVERERPPTHATEDARLNVARAEEALIQAQRNLEAAQRRGGQAPRK